MGSNRYSDRDWKNKVLEAVSDKNENIMFTGPSGSGHIAVLEEIESKFGSSIVRSSRKDEIRQRAKNNTIVLIEAAGKTMPNEIDELLRIIDSNSKVQFVCATTDPKLNANSLATHDQLKQKFTVINQV